MSTPVTAPPVTGIGLYTKLIVSAAVTAGFTYYTAQSDHVVDMIEWLGVLGTFIANCLAVWAMPMTPKWLATYGKAVSNGVITGIGSLVIGLTDGVLESPEVTAAVLAFIVGTGLVTVAPNAASSDPVGADGKQVPIPAEVKEELATEGTSQTTTVNGVVTVDTPPVEHNPFAADPEPPIV